MESIGVVLDTELGMIELAVYPGRAPVSTHAFLRFVDDGTLSRHGVFYRTVRKGDNDRGTPEIDVVQGGWRDAPPELSNIEHEATTTSGLKHVDGAVSLARGEVGSASGAIFFICVGDQRALDAGGTRKTDGQGFAVFGRVTRGMSIVRSIHAQPTREQGPNAYQAGQILETPVRILRAVRNAV